MSSGSFALIEKTASKFSTPLAEETVGWFATMACNRAVPEDLRITR